ncbi:MAG: metallophosphoesterase [Chloroflexi bacterium]|nr:metallophosphoesterase [Chloroflexota bacterium]OJV91307.1 MAG: hypothetical protein BGO39_27055 [Chloroflexi bacterium 54-19]
MRFILLGDLHYSVYQGENSKENYAALREEFFDRLFQTVRAVRADVVIAIGDTTDNGLPEEFAGLHACAARNEVDFITVNGNHDVLTLTKPELSFYTGNRFPYYTRYFNPVTGQSDVTDPQAARFLILDTPKERNPKDHGGYVGPEQLAWLTNQLIESGDKPLFAFGHHPVGWATRYANFPMLNIDNSKEVWRAFATRRKGNSFYFCGHNHANSVTRRGNWHFIQTAAPLRTADFRLVEFTPGKVHMRTVPLLGGAATARLGNQLADALGDFSHFPARGFSRDRELVVPLGSSFAIPEGVVAKG